MERAVLRLTGERSRAAAAGRTDSGVHALGQAVLVRTHSRVQIERWPAGLTAHLPEDVAVVAAREVGPAFNVQRDAVEKLYRYEIRERPVRTVLERKRALEIWKPLDVESMRRAGEALVGTHDFHAFSREPWRRRSTVRTVRRLEVGREGPRVWIEVAADGFLYNMVRGIAGTLIAVGLGRKAPEEVAKVLESKDRSRAGPTAPPHGLYLVKVVYP